jgi:hypothetical protein
LRGISGKLCKQREREELRTGEGEREVRGVRVGEKIYLE